MISVDSVLTVLVYSMVSGLGFGIGLMVPCIIAFIVIRGAIGGE
jgi:hypothetical protein